MKIIKLKQCSREEADRFEKESEMLQILKHRNIISYKDFVKGEHRYYLIMELA